MAELNEAFELQKINNVNNPYVMTDKTFYEMSFTVLTDNLQNLHIKQK